MRFTFRQHQRFIRFALTAFVGLLLLVALQKTAPVKSVINLLRVVISEAGNAVGSGIEHIFYSKSELIKTNQRLEEKLQHLALDQAALQSLTDQYIALSALLHFSSNISQSITTASVISRTNDLSGEAILLDRGEVDGLQIGDPVIADDGFLVAIIAEVRPATSIARLITDQQSKIAVRILNTDSTIGIAEGQNGELLRVNFIPQSVDLELNDLMVTSGLGDGIPAGLVLGTVDQVIRDEHDPFQQALVQPLVDLRRLSVVAVLLQL